MDVVLGHAPTTTSSKSVSADNDEDEDGVELCVRFNAETGAGAGTAVTTGLTFREATREAPRESECDVEREPRDREALEFCEVDLEVVREDRRIRGPLCDASVVGAGSGMSSKVDFSSASSTWSCGSGGMLVVLGVSIISS